MKKTGLYCGMLWILLGIAGCEKDDICPETTPTTPSVFIRFFDRLDPTRPNSEGTLKYYESENEKTVTRSGSEIKLPLRLDRQQTVWVLELTTLDNAGAEVVRRDTLSFKYELETLYVSKACGYKNIFTLVDNSTVEENPQLNHNGVGNWINRYQIMTTNITTEADEHIKIYY
ncbi:DUF6452 family protein [Flavobacterium sp. JP2137]|uniref:DUF6452 family protein n=1 Tax=Flavobacterium sp. JP2137 TaxID=3414510 RepID=UPI003D2FEE44